MWAHYARTSERGSSKKTENSASSEICRGQRLASGWRDEIITAEQAKSYNPSLDPLPRAAEISAMGIAAERRKRVR
jgi:hypothetical protein